MHPNIIRWINHFLMVSFDMCALYDEPTDEKKIPRFYESYSEKSYSDNFFDDDYFFNTDSTTINTQPTAPIGRFYGKFGVSEAMKRRHSRYFFESLWFFLLTLGLGAAERQLALDEINIQFRDPRRYWFAIKTPKREGNLWFKLENNIEPLSHWKKKLRMTRTQFYKFLDLFEGSLEPGDGPNWRSVPGAHKLAFFLYFLAHKAEIAVVADLFGIAPTTGSNFIKQVSDLICDKIQPKLIHMPWADSDMRAKVEAYENRFGLPGVFAAIDGSHFKIKKPPVNPLEYHCYKGYHSFNVQAICDSNGLFLDVFASHPGRIHDSRLWENSEAKTYLEEKLLGSFSSEKLPGIQNYILGDPGYTLEPWVIIEFLSCKTRAEILFNMLLRSGRNVIERAFGRLKARWRYVSSTMGVDISRAPALIMSAFTLHNFLELEGDKIVNTEAYHTLYKKSVKSVIAYGHGPRDAASTPDGREVRQSIVAYIQAKMANGNIPKAGKFPKHQKPAHDPETDPESDWDEDTNVTQKHKYDRQIDGQVYDDARPEDREREELEFHNANAL